ncbi:PREDICTED: probable calcium-binding protein CML44 [Nelumbo nucifera]|uniref:EF-hand domain-containing protein n=2 Tax=Nelumbo nucifera TaxID=4432 RepID=A0A822Z430_NELNU|nr:PREDICTED: probable calcium-binding protein CML44 [Nelumbo nucifera]DAD39812.1 TPA_asm: hypothetical protein HUJ06_014135 [Nelumbo nucifera]
MSHIHQSDLERIFVALDLNGDGRVCIGELTWFLDKVGVHIGLDELEEIVGGRSLGLQEFIHLYNQSISKPAEEDEEEDTDLVEAFKVFDLNNDGFISCEELQSLLARLGLWSESYGDCRQLIGKFDTNLDGRIDFEEFKNMMLLSIS